MVITCSAIIKNNEERAVNIGAVGHLALPGNTDVIKYIIRLITE